MLSPFRVILVGPPGVGKGTQAVLLEKRTGAIPLSSGTIFRTEIEAETDLGELAKSYIDRGELVPNGVTNQMMFKRLRRDDVRRSGFILDGYPRTIRQAEALTKELTEEGIALNGVVFLECDDALVVQRLAGRMGCTKCGEIYHSLSKPPKREGFCDRCNNVLVVRGDDIPEVISQRIRVFAETTKPVVGYYEGRGELLRVDATKESAEVFQQIAAGLHL